MKKLLCLSTALLCLSASLFSCGDKNDSSSKDAETTTAATTAAAENKAEGDADISNYLGKWECKEIVIDGEKSDNFYGMDAFALFQIELLEDGKGNFFSFLEFKEKYEFTEIEWELTDDGNIKLIDEEFSDEEDDFDMSLKNGKLVMDMSDDESEFVAYLEKVNEFSEIPEDEEFSFDFSTEGDFEFDDSDLETDTTDAE